MDKKTPMERMSDELDKRFAQRQLISHVPGLDAAYEHTPIENGPPAPYADWASFMRAYWGQRTAVVLVDNGLLDGYRAEREDRIDRYRKAIKGE